MFWLNGIGDAALKFMSPLLLVGATSVAKYLATRAACSMSPSAASGGVGKDFRSVLRDVSGPQSVVPSSETQARLLEKQLLEAPEVKLALAAQPFGAVSSLRVQQDGSVTLIGAGPEVGLNVGAVTRTIAQQIFSNSASSMGAVAPLAIQGMQSVNVTLPGARVV